MLSPICPHVCEYIWELLGKPGSIMHEKWPMAGPVDEKLIQISQYVTDAAHDFRIRLKQLLTPAKGKKVKLDNATHGTIWIAKTYPPWQNTVLSTLKTLHEACLDYLCLLFIHDDIMVFGSTHFIFVFFNEKIYRFSFLEKQRLPGHEGYSKRLQGQARVEEVHEETDAFCASSKGNICNMLGNIPDMD